jgi:hypothetical protein
MVKTYESKDYFHLDIQKAVVCCYNYCWSDSECRINLVGLSIKVCEKASWNLIYTKEQMKRNEKEILKEYNHNLWLKHMNLRIIFI